MENYIELLKKTKLFKNIDDHDILTMLACFDATVYDYKKDEVIINKNDKVEHIYIILKGSVLIKEENKTLKKGSVFGLTTCCREMNTSQFNVNAKTNVIIMKLAYYKILYPHNSSYPFYTLFIKNILNIVSEQSY